MIAGIVLAAGESKRMGEIKQLLDWQGEPVIRRTVRNVCSGGFDLVRVVIGAYADKLAPILDDLNVELIYNPHYREGQSISVKSGLAGLDGFNAVMELAQLTRLDNQALEFSGAAFIPGDMPLIQAETFGQMIEFFRKVEPGILVPTYQGERGNPVFFHRRFFAELSLIQGDRGGREVFGRYPEAVQMIPVDDRGILLDLDSPEDYQRLKAKFDR